MEADIREFFLQFSYEELFGRKILGPSALLQAPGVSPLLALMEEHGITRLVYESRGWYLDSDGSWGNPSSRRRRNGDKENPLGIFDEQNNFINPHFQGISKDEDDEEDEDEDEDEEEDEEYSVHLLLPPGSGNGNLACYSEFYLQRAVRAFISQLEPGLTIIDGGKEKSVEAGRIDITAEDTDGNLVAIELKVGTAGPEAIAQLLAYMGTVDNPARRKVRGILVANEFSPRVVQAAQAVSNVALKAYSFQMSFQDR